jgi:hypothetical protein
MSTHPRFPSLLLTVALAALAAGCQTPDLTTRYPGTGAVCEVHRTAMQAEVLPVVSGEAVHRSGYLAAAQSQFPHHGIQLFQSERPSLPVLARQARDYVCPQCTQAYQEYWK